MLSDRATDTGAAERLQSMFLELANDANVIEAIRHSIITILSDPDNVNFAGTLETLVKYFYE